MNSLQSNIASLLQQADQLFERNELDQACRLYAQVCQLDPDNLQALLQLARGEYALQQYIPCLQSLERALGLDPDNLPALLIASAASIESGQFEQAVRLSEAVLARETDHLAALLNKSTALLRLGRFEEALLAANRAAAIDPQQLTAHMNRAMTLFGLGQYQPALAACDEVLTLHPRYLNALLNRSSILQALGRHSEALAAADEVLRLQPGAVSALLNRAAALLRLQCSSAALETLDKILMRNPGHLKALLNRALALLELKRFEEALAAAAAVLELEPVNSGARSARIQALVGMELYTEALTEIERMPAELRQSKEISFTEVRVLLGLRRYAEASATVERLLRENPTEVNVLLLEAEMWLWLQKAERALACLERGLAIYPDRTDLLLNLALVLVRLRRHTRALALVEQVLAREAHHPQALVVKATVLNQLGSCQEALRISQELLASQTEEWRVYANLGKALAGLQRFEEAQVAFAKADELGGKAFKGYGNESEFQFRPTDSIVADIDPRAVYLDLEMERLARCEWRDYPVRIDTIRELTEQALAAGAHTPLQPFHSLYLPLSPELQLAVARSEAAHIVSGMAAIKDSLQLLHSSDMVDKLRIGYVSGDFRNHPTAHLMRSLFGIHDRREFTIYGYAIRQGDGSVYHSQIKADCDHFVDLTGLSNAQAARRIHEDGIHILVDLMGYTKYSRPEIFVLQPAPVQVSYLGYPGTLGGEFIQYIIADPVVLPVEQARYFSEQAVYLPDSYQVNDRWQEIAETGMSRVEQGLPDEAFVFCCFNQAYKLEPVMFAVWMRILRQVPDSVLWLYSNEDEVQSSLRREAEALGIAGGRLVFAQRLPKDRHLERHRLADLFLDTRIYNAHTTASDALWAGLPVLTCKGGTFAGRVGASLLGAVGMPELIAADLADCERRAIHLASHPEELSKLRGKLAGNRLESPLFDTERWVRHLEQAYRLMWSRHQKGQRPGAIWVTPARQADRAVQPRAHTRRSWLRRLRRSLIK